MDYRYLQKLCTKNHLHQVVWANRAFLACIGLRNSEKALGLTDYDLPWNMFANIYKKHELDTLAGNCYSTFQPVTDSHGNNFIGLITKYTSLDKHGNTLIHTNFNEVVNMDVNVAIQKLLEIDKVTATKNYDLGRKDFKLSSRELECLFYTVRGKSSKAIARILNLSHRTVEQYIANIKIKLGCYTKNDLIERSINSGLINIIPGDIFKDISNFINSLKE